MLHTYLFALSEKNTIKQIGKQRKQGYNNIWIKFYLKYWARLCEKRSGQNNHLKYTYSLKKHLKFLPGHYPNILCKCKNQLKQHELCVHEVPLSHQRVGSCQIPFYQKIWWNHGPLFYFILPCDSNVSTTGSSGTSQYLQRRL